MGVDLPPQALPPAFGASAFRGSVLDGSNPVADRTMTDPAPFHRDDSLRIRPVRVTEFSAGNQVRLGIVGTLREYWRFQTKMSGEFFVANSDQYHRLPNRRMARVRRFVRVVPNRRGVYKARTYGGTGDVPYYAP